MNAHSTLIVKARSGKQVSINIQMKSTASGYSGMIVLSHKKGQSINCATTWINTEYYADMQSHTDNATHRQYTE